ncbi:proton channel OtopLc-like isoform X4 [Bradysia coprophila]|uniref:proton channel OtopLc-like isoform X4 n=1 Tax=Bradysia coprophila TaxID=38358 RepID=UPI00187D9CF3|nr:proton channel OtopLc-like isoform X4 [Bradysia coprophila]
MYPGTIPTIKIDVMSDAPQRLPTTSEVNENLLSAQNSQLAVYNAHDGNNSIVKSSPGLQHLNRNINLNLSSEPGSVVALNTIHEINLSRRPSALLQDLLSTRRPSAVMAAIRTPNHRPRMLGSLHELTPSPSIKSLSQYQQNNYTPSGQHHDRNNEQAQMYRRKNRKIGDDALSSALSALYAKIIVILGVALPITEILTSRIPKNIYTGFYLYLYVVSIAFVVFVYTAHVRNRAVFSLLKTYHEKTNSGYTMKKRVPHFGSFYLRVGAISFGIGTMVYSGLEFGQYFEMNNNPECRNIMIALTPAARMALSIFQMQFIFLNTTELDMGKRRVIARFGLMHMIATNLCEWLYVLVEETKHEIHQLMHSGLAEKYHSIPATFTSSTTSTTSTTTEVPTVTTESMANIEFAALIGNGTFNESAAQLAQLNEINCGRTDIMGALVQNAAPFLFPCTIEYSLICAVILFEMWKKVKNMPSIERHRRNSIKPSTATGKSAHHFSVDCSRAHRGMFAGIIVIVLTIICLIMYFVMYKEAGYEHLAIREVTIVEILLYALTTCAVVAAVIKMRDLKFQQKASSDHHADTVTLDCTLLVLAQTGVYLYGMFSIMGSYFTLDDEHGIDGLVSEIFGLIQTSVQTLFILNSCWRRCRGAEQQRTKPGREIVTFLLVANMSMWFINTMIKGRAGFRPTHLNLYGIWAWTVITHVSMPLAIFYRFHSTICLFDIWKSAYKAKHGDHH